MNWKFWKREGVGSYHEPYSPKESFGEVVARIEKERQDRERAAFEFLPDHRKAARIEYKLLAVLRAGRVVEWPSPDLPLDLAAYTAMLHCPQHDWDCAGIVNKPNT